MNPAPSAGGPVRLDREGPVAIVTIDRPEKRNAIDRAVAEGMADAFTRFEADARLHVAVLTGAGGWFSAGMDLASASAGDPVTVEGRGFGGFVDAPRSKPVIAAVEDVAFGGGFELVLACDLVVAAGGARFALPEVARGRIPGARGLVRLPHRLPYHVVMELSLTGQPVEAERLHALGLVNRIVAPGEAREAACELAKTIAGNSPTAVRAARRLVRSAWLDAELGLRTAEEHLVDDVAAGPDAAEGARAFAERRAPVWTAPGR